MIDNNDIDKLLTRQQETFKRGFDSYFKYFSDNKDVIQGIFVYSKIRFTQPRAFNDPLEFNPTFRFRDEENCYQSYDLNGIVFPSIEQFFRVQVIESQINAYGILCLTKVFDSFDMWSQYANGHRGFLIKFKEDFNLHNSMTSNSGKQYPVKKVDYVDDYSICLDNLVNENKEIPLEAIHNELFFKKTSRWEHEREYRMVRPLSECQDYHPPEAYYAYTDTKPYLFPLDWSIVSSILLGANMSIENRSLIVQFCKENNISLFQCHVVRDFKDNYGKPGTILILGIDDYINDERLTQAKPQLLCTDTIRLKNYYKPNIKKIINISDLPYYKDYQEDVDLLYSNLKNRNG